MKTSPKPKVYLLPETWISADQGLRFQYRDDKTVWYKRRYQRKWTRLLVSQNKRSFKANLKLLGYTRL